ncbi:MAG: CRISPR-associated endonuclease Cas3'' [Candidatus Bathyarchaeia archaeon]
MISDDILSYYRKSRDGEEIKELLSDHIRDGIAIISDLDNSRLGWLVASRLRVHDLKDLVKLAIVFHDAGKAFYQTERNMREDKEKGEKYLSFMGHEFISSYIADRFVKEKNMQRPTPELYSVVFAVYFHHHAIGIEKREKEAIARLRHISQTEFETAKEKLKRVLEPFIQGEDREVLRKCIDRLSKNGLSNLALQQISNEIYERLIHRPNPRLRKLSLIVLDCLLACDYIPASNRGNSKSEFSQTMSNFHNIWMRRFRP